MRAAIVNPYFDTLGGGERYTLSAALVFAKAGYRVDVQWPNSKIRERLEGRFGVDLSEINFVKDVRRGDGYDLIFWVSDGSIPNLLARKNLLHFQVPFKDVNGKTLINRMKLFKIDKVICNSYFTKGFIDEEYRVNSVVVYPPVGIDKIKARKKENLIIYVGRFSQLVQAKRQDALVSAFKKFYDAGFTDFRLVIAGGVEVGVGDYLKKLIKAKEGYPIEILEGPNFGQLKELYGKAKIFWSAVGLGINENKEPQKVEHFGISLVEAMAGGAVPVVYRAGGYKEIVKEGEDGFFWEKPSQLVAVTKKIAADKKLAKKISLAARAESQRFSYSRFREQVEAIISSKSGMSSQVMS